MRESNRHLDEFVQKITEIQTNAESGRLTMADRKDIALGLGMTEDEWRDVERYFTDSVRRGRGFLEYRDWAGAVRELEQALAINPDDPETLFLLAAAHEGKWKDRPDGREKKKALAYASRCLAVDPDRREALALISRLERSRPRRRVMIPVLLVAAIVAVIGLVFGLQSVSPPAVSPSERDPARPEETALQGPAGITTMLVPYVSCVNRHSSRIRQSFNRYLSWIKDPAIGPTGTERTVYGLYTIYDSDAHLAAIKDMNERATDCPDLGVKGDAYYRAFATLKPVLAEAYTYYDNDDYLDDGFAKGKELHAPLVYAFKKYIQAEGELRSVIEGLHQAHWRNLAAGLEGERDGREYRILHLAESAERMMAQATGMTRRTDTGEKFPAALEEFANEMDEFAFVWGLKEKEWDVRRFRPDDYRNFIRELNTYRRTASQENDADDRHLHASFWQLASVYNHLVESTNAAVLDRFPARLAYLRLTVPGRLTYPVE